MWSNLDAENTSGAAEFVTDCSRLRQIQRTAGEYCCCNPATTKQQATSTTDGSCYWLALVIAIANLFVCLSVRHALVFCGTDCTYRQLFSPLSIGPYSSFLNTERRCKISTLSPSMGPLNKGRVQDLRFSINISAHLGSDTKAIVTKDGKLYHF